MVAIAVLLFSRRWILKLLHRVYSKLDPSVDGPYDESLIATLDRPLKTFGVALGFLLLTDAACYTLYTAGVITKGLAGLIPSTFDTLWYAVALGQLLTGIKTHLLRKDAGLSAKQPMRGPVALKDRIWGYVLWSAVTWSCATSLRMEMVRSRLLRLPHASSRAQP